MNKRFLLIIILSLISVIAYGQIEENTELFITLKEQDSTFFERGFNQCDLEYLGKHIADDFKFYHDQSGFQDRNIFFENTKQNICSNSERKPIRKLEEGSLTVFPLYNNGTLYGAIQSGSHNFYIRVAGEKDIWTSTAKFTHVWILENDTWKLSEVLSYDHHDPKPEK